MFMLESRLSADQNRVLELVQASAGAARREPVSDQAEDARHAFGGFRVRDLDFSVEGQALKVAKDLVEQGAQALAVDEYRRTSELVFASGVTAQVSMARKRRYTKTRRQAARSLPRPFGRICADAISPLMPWPSP